MDTILIQTIDHKLIALINLKIMITPTEYIRTL